MIDAVIGGRVANPAVVWGFLGHSLACAFKGATKVPPQYVRMPRKNLSQSSNLSRAEGLTSEYQQDKWSQGTVYTHRGFAHAEVTFLYHPRNKFTEILWDTLQS